MLRGYVGHPREKYLPLPTIYAQFKGSALPPCLYHPRRLIQGLYLGRISSTHLGFKTRGGHVEENPTLSCRLRSPQGGALRRCRQQKLRSKRCTMWERKFESPSGPEKRVEG